MDEIKKGKNPKRKIKKRVDFTLFYFICVFFASVIIFMIVKHYSNQLLLP